MPWPDGGGRGRGCVDGRQGRGQGRVHGGRGCGQGRKGRVPSGGARGQGHVNQTGLWPRMRRLGTMPRTRPPALATGGGGPWPSWRGGAAPTVAPAVEGPAPRCRGRAQGSAWHLRPRSQGAETRRRSLSSQDNLIVPCRARPTHLPAQDLPRRDSMPDALTEMTSQPPPEPRRASRPSERRRSFAAPPTSSRTFFAVTSVASAALEAEINDCRRRLLSGRILMSAAASGAAWDGARNGPK